MAAPTRVSLQTTNSGYTTGSSLTLIAPSPLHTGYLSVIVVASNSSGLTSWNTPTGWTKIGSYGSSYGTIDYHISAWWKLCSVLDGNVTVSFSGYASQMYGVYMQFNGFDVSAPINSYNGNTDQTNNTDLVFCSSGDVVTTVDDCYAMGFGGVDYGSGVNGVAGFQSGWSQCLDAETTGATSGLLIAGQYKTITSAGNIGGVSIDLDSASYGAGVVFAIAPGAGVRTRRVIIS